MLCYTQLADEAGVAVEDDTTESDTSEVTRKRPLEDISEDLPDPEPDDADIDNDDDVGDVDAPSLKAPRLDAEQSEVTDWWLTARDGLAAMSDRLLNDIDWLLSWIPQQWQYGSVRFDLILFS